MLQHRMRRPRIGALAVEAAIVHPVMLFLMLAIFVGGTGVFRYQQVACQAREAARYAAVHGSDWHRQTDQSSPTQNDILNNVVTPLAAGMDKQSLSLKIFWIDAVTGNSEDWDTARKDPQSLTKTNDYVTNKVRVTVTYQYSPAIYFFGSLTFTSTSEYPMSY
jgi:Flp pilus assembly protein TadG